MDVGVEAEVPHSTERRMNAQGTTTEVYEGREGRRDRPQGDRKRNRTIAQMVLTAPNAQVVKLGRRQLTGTRCTIGPAPVKFSESMATEKKNQMSYRQKPGEDPQRPGPYVERGPRGGQIPDPRHILVDPRDHHLPPTQKPNRTWEPERLTLWTSLPPSRQVKP